MICDNYGLGHLFFPGFGMFLQLLIFFGFLGIIYWVLKSGRMSNETAEDILKKRLAKGDIKKEEYDTLLEEIRKK